jgi:regulator of protease activity HflC (stomatin/prohibitin superfamily)
MVSKLVRDNLERRASRFNLVLDDVSITHVTFSPAFSEAVEAKQIAQQTAQRAAYLVDQALQEKQSIIVKAQGEARSAELIGEAVKQNKGYVARQKNGPELGRKVLMAGWLGRLQIPAASQDGGRARDRDDGLELGQQAHARLGLALA